jgi:hypothetical protein
MRLNTAFAVAALLVAAPALAQDKATAPSSQSSFPWGVIGAVGLVGLLGARKRAS